MNVNNFHYFKATVKKMRSQATDWAKIAMALTSD